MLIYVSSSCITPIQYNAQLQEIGNQNHQQLELIMDDQTNLPSS